MAAASFNKMKKQFDDEISKFQASQTEMQKYVESRKQLEAQKRENMLVESELKLLAPEARLFKLIGPALIPQQQQEAVETVNKRLDYINTEIKRVEALLDQAEKNKISVKDKLQNLQTQLQQLQVKAEAAAP